MGNDSTYLVTKPDGSKVRQTWPPSGTSETTPGGIKHDTGKPEVALLSPVAILKVAQVMSFGATKYDEHNWRKGITYSRLLSAAMRHMCAYIGGEDKDPESGLSHLAHACACLFMVLEFEETKPELDNRFKIKKGV